MGDVTDRTNATPRLRPDPPRGVLKGAIVPTRHVRYLPSPSLAHWVEHIWCIAWDLSDGQRLEAETLPHPSVHLVLERHRAPEIAGVYRGRFTRVLEGSGEAIGVKFRPGAFTAFDTTPARVWLDRRAPAGVVFGDAAIALSEAVPAAVDDASRVMAIETFLLSQKPASDARIDRIARLVEACVHDRAITQVAQLARIDGSSVRDVQRLFSAMVGITPKWMIQRYRLHDAIAQLEHGPQHLADLAASLGYADQAHFIRDFRTVIGCTPAQYACRP